MGTTEVELIGGKFHGNKISLSRTPKNIQIMDQYYSQITDPDTGEGLGVYVFRTQVEEEDF